MLPSHLDEVDSTLIKSWNEDRKKIELQIDKNLRQLRLMYADLFSSISSSSDVVSNELTKLFTSALHFDEELYDKALVRKQLGNPHGKPKDNMGDQISWEILLSKVPSVVELIIITRDTDYYTQYNDSCYLNPQLHKELLTANKGLHIKCFNKLSDALKD
ncbi:hypothetical protein [Pedobacter sandarakinus]|uniref:hypothetical protein n=1 Tax=Pedobacter sandarakinus TaxID=353156 RepID=UPI002247A070|nr:hypothetical protein [Pedobacter sandarakinus]MCX2573657.1 hypothetical protein [Pedobacter sandarakinus]